MSVIGRRKPRRLPRATFSNVDSSADSAAIDRQVRWLLEAGEPLYGVDVQLVERLRPELIVTQAQCDVCAVKFDDVLQMVRDSAALASCPVAALNPTSLNDVFADIRRVAQAAGASAAGEERVAALVARVEAVRRRSAEIPAHAWPRVALIEWVEPVFLAANWMPELTKLAAGDDGGFARPGEHSVATSWERVAEFDPEVLVVMPCGFDLERTALEARRLTTLPRWRDLSSTRMGRNWIVDGNAYFNRSGPRLVESLEILAHLLHPMVHPSPAGIDLRAAGRKFA